MDERRMAMVDFNLKHRALNSYCPGWRFYARPGASLLSS